ncbi:hypothetical protein Acr_17g0008000 [Actinidia rufa]|uniref:Uncharacterized protein n=1 Tax=Actinidia rufa TaxID=165716 RepID=A0A7J0G386_9ERIC|nr:hypothetical protein Acr_17g0008000 [Actinidia rufa]
MFHKDNGHNTEDCFQLKKQIANLIKRGYLRKYVADRPRLGSLERGYIDNRPTTGDIQTIHGRFASRGYSSLSRKRHAREANRRAEEEVYNLSTPMAGAHQIIIFTNDNLKGLHLLHDDALVISATISIFNFQMILIDNGSSTDILFISAFDKIGIGRDRLHLFHTPLVGFGGNSTNPLWRIKLPLTLGVKPH